MHAALKVRNGESTTVGFSEPRPLGSGARPLPNGRGSENTTVVDSPFLSRNYTMPHGQEPSLTSYPQLRVLHITPALFGVNGVFGGAERYSLELARHMARVCRTTLVSFAEQPLRYTTPEGLRVVAFGPPRMRANAEIQPYPRRADSSGGRGRRGPLPSDLHGGGGSRRLCCRESAADASSLPTLAAVVGGLPHS